MIGIATSLTKQAEQLPPEDRIKLVDHLLTTLDQPDGAIDDAWAAEYELRI